MIPIFETAFASSVAQKKIKEKADLINRNVLKCSIYSKDMYNRSHWVGRIADCLDYVNGVFIKPKDKLKESFYTDEILAVFGNEIDDALSNVKDFRIKNRENIDSGKKHYNDFEITEDKVSNTFEIYNLLKDKYCKILADKHNKITRDDFYNMLMEDFENILK